MRLRRLLEQESNTESKQVRPSFRWLNLGLGVGATAGPRAGMSKQRAARAPRGLAAVPCQEAPKNHTVDHEGVPLGMFSKTPTSTYQ